MVGLTGFEPVTSRLSGERSNQLSYSPINPKMSLPTLGQTLLQSAQEWTILVYLHLSLRAPKLMARLTGLEPAALGVTGRYSNQLSYNRLLVRGLYSPDSRHVIS